MTTAVLPLNLIGALLRVRRMWWPWPMLRRRVCVAPKSAQQRGRAILRGLAKARRCRRPGSNPRGGMTMSDNAGTTLGGALDKAALRRKYLEERAKRLRADGNEQYLQLKGRLAHYLEDPYTPRAAARAAHRSRDLRVHRRRLRRAGDRCAPGRGRHPRCAHRREGRRLRRHLVLEPLPRRAVRHGVDGVHAAARGNRAHAVGEVRARAGDPRALPAHRPPVRAVRPARSSTPKCKTSPGTTSASAVADPHRSRRRVHRAVHRPGHRPAARAEAAGHPRHRVVQGPFVPHQPLGLRLHGRRSRRARRWPSWPTSAWPSSAPAPRRCSACRTSPATAARCSCSSARRRRWTCAPTHRSIPPGSRPSRPRGGSSAGSRTSPPTRRAARRRRIWCRTAGPTCRAASARGSCNLPREQMTPPNMLAAFEDSDYEKMEEIRARVDAIVEDRDTAQKLKAWYRQLCKRPCFHDEYLQAFNSPNTTLVDTDGKGVERITERGVVVAGVEYPGRLHHLRLGVRGGHANTSAAPASTSRAAAGSSCRSTGRRACAPSTASTCTAFRTRSSCNPRKAPTSSPTCRTTSPRPARRSRRSCATRSTCTRARSKSRKEAEDAWLALLLSGPGMLIGSQDCTPGYYNNEGQDPGLAREAQCRLPGGPQRVLSLPRRMARVGPLRGPGVQNRVSEADVGGAGLRKKKLSCGLRGGLLGFVASFDATAAQAQGYRGTPSPSSDGEQSARARTLPFGNRQQASRL